MKDKLEKYMQDHRDEFDVFEPAPDLWKKIIPEEETKVIGTLKTKNWVTWAYRVAAMLVVGFMSIYIYEKINKQDDPVADTSSIEQEVDPEIMELIEAETYYSHECDTKMKELENYSVEFASIKDDIFSDIAELDTAYMELKVELGGDINKKEVIEMMIQNYRYKLEILEEILNQLKGVEEEENEIEEFNI